MIVKTFQTPDLKLNVWHNEDHTVPVVSVVISFRAGGCYTPEAKAGIAGLLAEMLLEGAGDLPTQKFHERLVDKGIELHTQADADRLVLVMRTPKKYLEEALTLLRLVLHEPRFDHEAFERVKKLAQASLANTAETPGWIAARNLDKTLFGTHPYHQPVEGTPDSVATINVRDIGKFMKDHFSLDRVRLAASGDITERDLGRALDKLLKGLPEKGFRQQLSEVRLPQQGDVRVQKTSHPQAVLFFAHKGLPHSHEDFMKYYVINYILGGGAESRMMQEIRDQAGLAYTASSQEKNRRYVSLLAGFVGTKGASAAEAHLKVRQMFQDLRDKGLRQEELDLAKKHLIGSFPMNFTSSKQTAQVLHFYQIARFKPDYLEKRNQMIESLTLEDVNAFAKDFFKPESLIFSIAGDVPDKDLPTKADLSKTSYAGESK